MAKVMKKVLILSYHYPPQDIIAAYRGKAFADHLPAFGYRPTILTHHWEDPDHREIEYFEEEFRTIIRLPLPDPREKVSRKSGLRRKAAILKAWVNGLLEPDLKGNYRIFKDFLFHHLKEKSYDLLIGIYSPHFALKLCYEAHRAFGPPYVLDFRDLWANRVVKKGYRPNWRMAMDDSFTTRLWRKWLKKAAFFSITSHPWCEEVQRSVIDKPGVVVRNGFEEELFQERVRPSSPFQILHAGTLYKHQKISLFLEGLSGFLEERPDADLQVHFIGAQPGSSKGFFNGYRKASC
ncbi:MAG: glycosyltransferase [Flavobacteriales bacterium]